MAFFPSWQLRQVALSSVARLAGAVADAVSLAASDGRQRPALKSQKSPASKGNAFNFMVGFRKKIGATTNAAPHIKRLA